MLSVFLKAIKSIQDIQDKKNIKQKVLNDLEVKEKENFLNKEKKPNSRSCQS